MDSEQQRRASLLSCFGFDLLIVQHTASSDLHTTVPRLAGMFRQRINMELGSSGSSAFYTPIMNDDSEEKNCLKFNSSVQSLDRHGRRRGPLPVFSAGGHGEAVLVWAGMSTL